MFNIARIITLEDRFVYRDKSILSVILVTWMYWENTLKMVSFSNKLNKLLEAIKQKNIFASKSKTVWAAPSVFSKGNQI